MSIVAFLRARLDEDVAVAKAARGDGDRVRHGFDVREDWGRWRLEGEGPGGMDVVDEAGNNVTFDQEGLSDSVATPAIGEHIARHDPARVLREVEAKRRIVDDYRVPTLDDCQTDWDTPPPLWTLQALASVYADHPDYDPEWA